VILTAESVDAPLQADVAVIGAGPAGIVTALELADGGIDVVLLESGADRYDAAVQALGDAADWNKTLHAPMAVATRRQIGGTSSIWGGRCVPYDPVDFERRPFVTDHVWPMSYDELTPYFQRACDWFVCGRAVFDATDTGVLPPSIVPGLPNETARTSALERWSMPTHFGRQYGARLAGSSRVRLVTGATCTRIRARLGEGVVDQLDCRTLQGKPVTVRARRYVVACGGLESTRLLLASRDEHGRAIGNHSDHLGRWYMGHIEGVIASARFSGSPRQTIYGFERDVDGVYVRRRLTFTREFQRAEGLPNIASWLVHPELAHAQHRSGVLSFAYLALASPLGRYLAPEALRLAMIGERVPGVPYGGGERAPVGQHVRNLVRDALPTLRFAFEFGAKRFLARGRRVPGFVVYNAENVYPLQYHGEHLPRRDSRVTISEDRDRTGLCRLRIDVRYSDGDVEGVLRAHEHWDAYLRRHGAGRLEYLTPDPRAEIRRRFGAGFHQTGTTRLSRRADDGVVDEQLAIHGLPQLHVVSSSVFPTSGQANSTFMIVVFAVRLAEYLKKALS
jgi:choline dehydrogenase-like flavoprotein